jgi:MFS transporter, FHS family, L-fucose permease
MTKRSHAVPVFLAFPAMGFAGAASPFVGGFGILSVPMGVCQDKKGKKFILMLGLSTWA